MCRFPVALRNFSLAYASLFALTAHSETGVETLWTSECPSGHFASSPAIGDIDLDGRLEVVVTTTGGSVIALDGDGKQLWRHDTGETITIPPTLANVIDDATPEILVLSEYGNVHCIDAGTGSPVWIQTLTGKVDWGLTAIAAVDIDNDGMQEIIAGDSQSTVVCLRGDGERLWEYTGSYGDTLCPAVGDLDGDGTLEILVGGTETPLVCLSQGGMFLWKVDREVRGSSPVVWDLDGDGRREILVGLGEKLAAVNAQGDILWEYGLKGGIDSAISVADADRDGHPEIYAVDLSGQLVSLTHRGELRWTGNVQARARRSPSIADIDGDGVVEILVAGYSRAIHLFAPDGTLEERIPLSGEMNATATVADLQGDGRLCVICPTESGLLHTLRWPRSGPNATVLWPEYRGNVARTGSQEMPKAQSTVRIAEIDFGKSRTDSRTSTVQIVNPEGRDLTANLCLLIDGEEPSQANVSSSEKTIGCSLPYSVERTTSTDLTFRCTVQDGEVVVAQRTHRAYIRLFEKEFAKIEKRIGALTELIPQLVEPTRIEEQTSWLKMQIDRCRTRATDGTLLSEKERGRLQSRVNTLLDKSANLLPVVRAAVRAANAGKGTLFASVANPWAPFGGLQEAVEERTPPSNLTVEAFAGEKESAALNVFNFGDTVRTFRVTLDDLHSEGGAPPVPSRQVIALHEALDVPTQSLHIPAADALPTLNQANVLTVPAWDARQLWLNIDTTDLKPGTWTTQIHLRTLEAESREVTAKLRITVWDVKLPEEQALRLCHWGYVHSSVLKDQPEAALKDQVAHGTNVFVGLFQPQAKYNEAGELVGEIDFTAHDAYVRRHAPHGLILFCGYQGGLRGPGSTDSPAYEKAHVAWLRAWVKHLAEMGVSYDGFALYPVDEIGLHPGLLEIYRRYAKLAHEADPNILVYTDPTSGNTMEQLESVAPYTDIWCPNRSAFMIGNNEEQLAFMKSTGRTVWTYECYAHVKYLPPLGYYRGQAWLAWHHGLSGIGFWSYCTSRNDPWFAPRAENEYLLIYPGEGVVSSKRWEAIRDGVEDFSMLTALRQAADAAASRGEKPDAVREARVLLDRKASEIAEYCLPEEASAVPGPDGVAVFRPQADRRWRQMQTVRQELARLLVVLLKE